MKCPYCGGTKNMALRTIDTQCGRVRRRRVCKECGEKFTTYEVYVEEIKQKEEMAFMRSKCGRKPPKRDDT